MKGMMNNKKGITTIVIVLTILGALALFYIILLLPIPSFKAVRYNINYWAILLVFFVMQIGIIYIYYKGINSLFRGFDDIKGLFYNYTNRFRRFISLKFRI